MATTKRRLDYCPHCGAAGPLELGRCEVCNMRVCEKCGNTQHIKGDKHVIHDECLGKSKDSFSMIRFID